LKTIIGRVKLRAASVNTKAVFISSRSGRNENTFIKKFWVYMIQITARKLR
jgi:hypothetical protein